MRWGPRSLTSQFAVLLAVALLIAQAINVTLLLQSRERLKVARDEAAFARVLNALDRDDFVERLDQRPGGRQRPSRGLFFSEDAIAARFQIREVSSSRLREQLASFDVVSETAIVTHITGEESARLRERPAGGRPRQPDRPRQLDTDSVLVSVELNDGRWINVIQPLPVDPPISLPVIFAQTAITYLVLLAGVVFLARRLSRPLARLTDASQSLLKSSEHEAISLEGPDDVRQLTAAFNQMQDRVYRLFSEKDVMLGAIGHDLRTPLTSLRIRVESVDNENLRTAMIATLEEMSEQLEDILSLARTGENAATPEMVKLADFANDACAPFITGGADVSIGGVPQTSATFTAAPMRRVVRNLLENAVRYGGSATLSVEHADGTVRFVIEDDGPGIPEADLAKMREPFTRGEASRNRETGGAGLGLAIVSGLTERCGGSLSLQNLSRGGLRAVVSVPDQGEPPETVRD